MARLEPEDILRLDGDTVVMLDQRLLPREEVWVELRSAAEVADAIRTMVVRGAPAIGVAAAYGMVLAAASSLSKQAEQLSGEVGTFLAGVRAA